MDRTPDNIKEFVKSEVARITDDGLLAALRPRLITPHCVQLGWDYGKKGPDISMLDRSRA